MKKIFIGAMLLAGMSAFAQETYQNAEIATEDLNGTARYIGMGGAMEALGADISTIGTNPAGVGMFRRSQVSVSAGLVSPKNDDARMSFDQIGFVWSQRMGERSYMNLGFNYHKNRNFNGILSTADKLYNASQNKLTAVKGYEGVFDYDNCYTQVDYLNENTLGLYDEFDGWTFYEGTDYVFSKETRGYVGEYDFNISGNISDRVYLGLTMGLKDISYDSWTNYTENLYNYVGTGIGSVNLQDHRRISGNGVNVKAGIIIFPLEESSFRIGANITTPTWYDLTTSNYTTLYNNLDKEYGAYDTGSNDENYDYRVFTPWKFGLSAGLTVGTQLALGASYEFANYNGLQSRILEGGSAYDNVRSYKDKVMGENTKEALNGVHTLKIGAEYKVTPQFALRAGYNFVSAMYNKDGYRDGALNSPGTYYSSTTDYTNWKATDRVTLGAGYSFGSFGVDVAYQFTTQKGEFYPFMSYYGDTEADNCVGYAVDVKNNRHQVVATLSYKF